MDRDTAMVSEDWAVLGDELARWREAGRSATFWWRDDDAVQRTPALEPELRFEPAPTVAPART